ncbi:Fe-S cluster assembly sulfur transfer protein SufU [Neofamilia massiliensis]|uniref:Fe-S cluster assembly sulfur transfer protein SufU n=1 Tax=Neofamilia massiliensis TaxID=1673724 RepID=UPI0006BB7423|nr:SUF system NifU family Fe-S cluster assembly protein [Neofamilia massiliensis]
MTTNTFYNEILTEHNIRPLHKREIEGANLRLEGVNPSCGDEITVSLRVNADDIVEDGAFEGSGCAISQASADMMLDLIIGKTKDEALELADIFLRMIQKQASPEEVEMLEEASILEDVSNMPARVKCAVLGWRTVDEMLKNHEDHK